MYKYKIGIRPSDAFGVEIEFEGTELEKICNCCDVPLEYSLCHKAFAPKYNSWYLDLDLTVTKEKNGKFFGGEFTSRILRDDVKSWGELENICSLLINNNALSTPNCSTHITLDVSDYLKTPEDFKIFCVSDLCCIRNSHVHLVKSSIIVRKKCAPECVGVLCDP